MECSGLWITRNVVKPINRNTEAINNTKPPNSQKKRHFMCVVNYYLYVWPRRSHMLAHLSIITSNKIKFTCTKIEQDIFDEINRIVSCDTLLDYLNFYETFIIHSDASDFQLRAVIR